MCQEVGLLSFTALDHHRSEDGINGRWVKDHWGG
jgi:hypothetical protein